MFSSKGCNNHDDFDCMDGNCISRDKLCDGYNDCSNGDDEEGCNDFNTTYTDGPTEVYTEPTDYSETTTDYCKWFKH